MRPGVMALTTSGPDHRTSLADIRTLSCVLSGVDLHDIHPASGHDLSEGSYLRVRATWEEHIAAHGITHEDVRDGYQKARGYWAKHRPEYLKLHPWPPIP